MIGQNSDPESVKSCFNNFKPTKYHYPIGIVVTQCLQGSTVDRFDASVGFRILPCQLLLTR